MSSTLRSSFDNHIRRFRSLRELEPLRKDVQVTTSGPWQAYTPGLSHQATDLTFFNGVRALVARPSRFGKGEVLATDDGFSLLNSADGSDDVLPLGSANGRTIVRLDEFHLVTTAGAKSGDEDTTLMAAVAGDGSTDGSFKIYQYEPSSLNWDEVAWSAAAVAVPVAAPQSDRDGGAGALPDFPCMPDSCTFPLGAPGRTALTGAIAQPAWILTNNNDPTMVYPAGTGNLTFEPIQSEAVDGALYPFTCVSVETFGDRVYYFNTSENGTRYRQRLRRSARGTCDPLSTAVGAGSITMEEFSGNGVRAETLGNQIACYFEDGVAFVRETGIATAPNAVQIIERRRGLMSTHAVVPIGLNAHFGIFNDGWWFLDASGRWQRAGQHSTGSGQVDKWIVDFYDRLDQTYKHRIQMTYDDLFNWIRISVPTSATTSEIWIYDINHNRVWLDDYGDDQVSVWGKAGLAISSAVAWSSAIAGATAWDAGGVNADLLGTGVPTPWSGLGARFGTKSILHGTPAGNIYQHRPQDSNYGNSEISWSLSTFANDADQPLVLKTADRISVEYVNTGNTNPVTISAVDGKDNSDSDSIEFTDGSPGQVQVVYTNHRLTSEHLGVRINGTGPVEIRSFTIDAIVDGVEDRSNVTEQTSRIRGRR